MLKKMFNAWVRLDLQQAALSQLGRKPNTGKTGQSLKLGLPELQEKLEKSFSNVGTYQSGEDLHIGDGNKPRVTRHLIYF